MAYVDFGLLKKQVSIEQVCDMLGLNLKRFGAQWRGPCPTHGGGDRTLVITQDKGPFYNFCRDCQVCGDMIELVCRTRGIVQKEAADLIARHFGFGPVAAPSVTAETSTVDPYPGRANGELKPLDYLVTDHEALAPLGIAPETCLHFGAGFAPKGIMRGRLAIPIYRSGVLLAYVGRAVKKEQQPVLLFPKGFDTANVLFNADAIDPTPLHIAEDPLKVLLRHQHGVGNAIAVLSEIDAVVLEVIAKLMRDQKCETVTFI